MHSPLLLAPGNPRDYFVAFFTSHLKEVVAKSRVRVMFGMDSNIPYIAGVLSDFLKVILDPGNPLYYWFVEKPALKGVEKISVSELSDLEPVIAREITDFALIHRGLFCKATSPVTRLYSPIFIGESYRYLSSVYPDQSLREELLSLSENTEPWIEVLPHLRKNMNLLVI